MVRSSSVRVFCSITALVVVLQLILLQAMAASSELHHELHDHCDEPCQECVVTLMLHGGYASELPDITPVEVATAAPALPLDFHISSEVLPFLLAGGVLAEAPLRGP